MKVRIQPYETDVMDHIKYHWILIKEWHVKLQVSPKLVMFIKLDDVYLMWPLDNLQVLPSVSSYSNTIPVILLAEMMD